MHPELLRLPSFLGGVVVPSYGVALLLAAALGVGLGAWLGRRAGMAAWDAASTGLLAVAGGLLGAGLLDLAVNLEAQRREPGLPGLTFYGGLIGGAVAALLFVRRYRLPLGTVADVAAPSLALAHAVGRLGCFLGGCCFGSVATPPWPGVVFRHPLAPATLLGGGHALHPVQLYEAAGLLLLGLLLLLAELRGWWRGRLFLFYVAAYALLRLGLEELRGDPGRGGLGPLSTSQAIALVALVAVPLVWWAAFRRGRSRGAARG